MLRQLNSEQVQRLAALANLRRNVKDYPKGLRQLRDRLSVELKRQTGRGIHIDILADVLEIAERQECWRKAVEGYLNTQKFYLLIEPEHYPKALAIYDEIKGNYSGRSFGLVNIAKLREREHIKPWGDSLAQKIETDNELARAYIDYLLAGWCVAPMRAGCEDIRRRSLWMVCYIRAMWPARCRGSRWRMRSSAAGRWRCGLSGWKPRWKPLKRRLQAGHRWAPYWQSTAEACEQSDMGVREQLAYLGIYARPELYELSGKCILTTEAGSIRVDAVWPFGIALPSTAVDSILSIELSHIHKVVFIKNKTNYDELLLSELDSDTFAVYHGGFLSPQKHKLFTKIAQAVPEGAQVFFWAFVAPRTM